MATASSSSSESTIEITPSHPLYIHPNESPSIALVQPLLNGHNYHSWSRSIRMALMCKNKIGLIDGSVKKPAENSQMFFAWQRGNNLVSSWILNSAIPEISQSVIWLDTAYEIWKDLRERYAGADPFKLSDLIEDVHGIKQGNLSVTQYFTKLKTYWDELAILRPVPTCTCEGCTCGAPESMKAFVENDYVIRFIKGLNDEFDPVRSQVLLMKPLPKINDAFSMAVTFERKTAYSSVHMQSQSAPAAFMSNTNAAYPVFNAVGTQSHDFGGAVNQAQSVRPQFGSYRRGGPRTYQDSSKRPQCTHCGLLGHTVDRCYKKHGYPPGFKPRGQVNMVSGEEYVAGNFDVNANMYGYDEHRQQTPVQVPQMVNPLLTSEQYAQLMNLLKDKHEQSPILGQQSGNNQSAALSAQFTPTPGEDKGPLYQADDWIS